MSTICDVLDDLNIPYRKGGETPHVTHGWVGLVCPWCGSGTSKYGLGIHLKSLKLSCWKCGSHGLADALHEITGLPWPVIKSKLAGLERGDFTPSEKKKSGTYQEPAGVGPMLPVHRKYLEKRNFDPDEIERVWGVRGIGNAAKLSWRLFLPVLGRDSKPASWTTRAVGQSELRYVSAPPTAEKVPLKRTLYGEHAAGHAVIVVEGPTDVWRIGPGAVATYGVKYTTAQVALIAAHPVRVICYDNEPEALRQGRKLAEELRAFPGATYHAVLSGPDPDSSPPEEIAELRDRFLS